MQSSKRAFTLIELLVVIAIIAILAAILFPVFAQAKAAAKKSVDVSNNKQIGLGQLMYMNDSDDIAPLSYIVPTDADWWTGRMTTWKDAMLPYIKSGGRAYNNGVLYTTAGTGGVFTCPISDNNWATINPVYWGAPYMGPGDMTTRFPRGYAINTDAGVNETGNTAAGIVASWQGSRGLIGTPGSETSLTAPANTIMYANSRIYYTQAWVTQMGDECSDGGLPEGGSQFSCIQSTHNRNMNVAFYDGHVKNVPGQLSVTTDLWDSVAGNEKASPGFTNSLLNAVNSTNVNNGPLEWTSAL